MSQELETSVKECQLSNDTSLMEGDSLSEIFPLDPPPKTLHIITQVYDCDVFDPHACIRYRSTVTLILLILEVGDHSPHRFRTINSYVNDSGWTKQETEDPELPAISTLNFDRMSPSSQIYFLQKIICKRCTSPLLSLSDLRHIFLTVVRYGSERLWVCSDRDPISS